MKLKVEPISGLLLCLSIACSRTPNIATSVAPEDFNGRWQGTWSWDTAKSASLEIYGTNIKASNFPIPPISRSEMEVISGEGEAIFEREYTPRGKPCIYLNFPSAWHDIDVYISKDKQHIYYSYDPTMDQEIIFTRVPQ